MVGQGDTPDSTLKASTDTIEKSKIADPTTQLLKEIEKLRAERTEAFKGGVFSRVLEIDSATGGLFYRNPDKCYLKNKDDLSSLINQDKLSSMGREIFYMVLFPRDLDSSYPTRGQRENYERWLNVPFASLLLFQLEYESGQRILPNHQS